MLLLPGAAIPNNGEENEEKEESHTRQNDRSQDNQQRSCKKFSQCLISSNSPSLFLGCSVDLS